MSASNGVTSLAKKKINNVQRSIRLAGRRLFHSPPRSGGPFNECRSQTRTHRTTVGSISKLYMRLLADLAILDRDQRELLYVPTEFLPEA